MITSLSNIQIKNLIKLQKSSKERKEQKVFIVEGIRMFQEIPEEIFVKTYITEDFFEQHRNLFKDIEYELVKENIFKEISETKTPQGVLAIVKQLQYNLKDIVTPKNACIIVLESLQDPGNLGTIIRTGEGAGISGVIMNNSTVDIYNPKVIRSTMGSIYRVPFLYVDDLKTILNEMKSKGIITYAGHLHGNNLYEENFNKKTAFLIGNEGNGLTDELSNLADNKIKIPMCGKVESLNAAVASTVFMYEVLRQRSIK